MSLPHVPERERMSLRARVYMLILTLRHALIAFVCIALPHHLVSRAYAGIERAMPFFDGIQAFQAWGWAFAVIAALGAFSAYTRSATIAAVALGTSATLTVAWAGAFATSIILEQGGLIGPIVFGALALKDLVMLRNPLRDPFESAVFRLANRTPPRAL